jgi:hypothetical protein
MTATPGTLRTRALGLEACRRTETFLAPTARVAAFAAFPGAFWLLRRAARRRIVREETGPARQGRAGQRAFLRRWSRHRSIDAPIRNRRSPRQPTHPPGRETPRSRRRKGYLAELMTSRDRTVSTADLAPAFSRPCLAFMHLWNAGVPGTSPHSSHDWTSGPGPAAHADRSQRHPKSPAPRMDASLPPSERQCHHCPRRWQGVCFAIEGVDQVPSGAPRKRWPATSAASVRCTHALAGHSSGHERGRLLGRFLQSVVDGGRQFFTVRSHCQQVAAGTAIRRRLGLPPVVDRHAPQYPSVLWLHSPTIRRMAAWADASREKFRRCYEGCRTGNFKYYG